MEIGDFRHYIVEALKARQKAAPGFPISSFAAELGMSAQKLNQILKHKSGLSPSSANQVAKRLSLKGKDRDLFLALVEAKHHRSKIVREAASEKLRELQLEGEFDELSTEEFSAVSEWFYIAACVLVDVHDFQQDYEWIGKRLGITTAKAKQAFEKLFEVGFLRDDNGKWVRDASKFMVRSAKSDTSLQKYHCDLMHLSEQTITTEAVENRHFSASVMSINKEDLVFARESIDVFRKKLMSDLERRGSTPERVYAISVQFFPVDRKTTEDQTV